MTVAELVAALGEYPPGMRVVVDGYEDGYDDPHVKAGHAVLGEGGGPAWLGVHDSVSPRWDAGRMADAATVVVVSRGAPVEPRFDPCLKMCGSDHKAGRL